MSIWPNTKIDPVEAVNDTPVGVTFAAAVVVTAPIPDATWNPVKFTDPRTKESLTLRELLNSPFVWMESPEDFLHSGYEFKRSSRSDIAEMVSSYVEELRNEASGELLALRRDVNRQMTEAFGERGQSTWGNVVANLNGWWLMENREWFLA